MRRKISLIACRKTSTLDTKRFVGSVNTCGRNEPMKLRSDFSEALTKLHRLHRESGEERLAPIPTDSFLAISEMASVVSFIQHIKVVVERFLVELKKYKKSSIPELVKVWHVERGDPLCGFCTKLLRSDILQDFFVVVRSFTADSNLLQPTGVCEQHTSHVTFSR